MSSRHAALKAWCSQPGSDRSDRGWLSWMLYAAIVIEVQTVASEYREQAEHICHYMICLLSRGRKDDPHRRRWPDRPPAGKPPRGSAGQVCSMNSYTVIMLTAPVWSCCRQGSCYGGCAARTNGIVAA